MAIVAERKLDFAPKSLDGVLQSRSRKNGFK